MSDSSPIEAFYGDWQLNQDDSRYEFGPMPSLGRYHIEAHADALKITMEWQIADGQIQQQVYWGIPDGKTYPFSGNPMVDGLSMTLIDDHTLDTAAFKDQQRISFARRVLSHDKTRMTITMQGSTPQGQPYTNLAIYDRVSEANDGERLTKSAV